MGDASQPLRPSRLQRAFRRLYRWATLRLYDEFAWAYEAVAWSVSLGRWDAWRKQALDYVDDGHAAKGVRILELGFGTGELLIEAARRGLDAWGADPSVAMHRIAGRRARRSGTTLRRVVAPSQALPFASGAFDAILSTFPADYIADPATLAEAKRLLCDPQDDRPGGRLVITGIGTRVSPRSRISPSGAKRQEERCAEADTAVARRRLRRSSAHGGGRRIEAVAVRLLGGLLSLIFGGGTEDSVALYARFAQGAGFDVTISEGTGAVRVPVLILSKPGSDVAEGSA